MVSRRLSKAGLVFHPRARHVGPNSVPTSTATYGSLADLRIRTLGGPLSFFSWLTLFSGRAGPSAGQILWWASVWLVVRSAAAELKRPGSTGGRDRAVRHARSFLCLPRTPLSAWAAGAGVHVPVDGGRARQKVSWGEDGRRREAGFPLPPSLALSSYFNGQALLFPSTHRSPSWRLSSSLDILDISPRPPTQHQLRPPILFARHGPVCHEGYPDRVRLHDHPGYAHRLYQDRGTLAFPPAPPFRASETAD